jgi:tripartite-type tricarboxylate transporter receptor subunit TctC
LSPTSYPHVGASPLSLKTVQAATAWSPSPDFLGTKDDHTLLVSPVSSFTAHPYFHDKLPYDQRDLIPIARISKTVVAVSVPTSLNVNSLKELEALARSKPGQLNWTTATGFTDFVFAGYLHAVGLKMAKVPYKNPAGAAADLASGVIQVYMPLMRSCVRR